MSDDKRLEIEKEAMIFGFLLGDGHLTKNGDVSFTGDKEGLENIRNDMAALYGDVGNAKISEFYSESKNYGIKGTAHRFSSIREIGRRYIELGCPFGSKVDQSFTLPDWIVEGTFEIKRNFISGLYSAEGYTPSMQMNGKTLRTMGFNMHRRKSLEHTLPEYMNQYSKIIDDVGIGYTYNQEVRITCEENIRFEFQFDNNEKNIFRLFELLDLRYCPKRQKRIDEYKPYYETKKKIVDKLAVINEYSLTNRDESATVIAEKFGINRDLIYQWRKRDSSVRLPSSFPTFKDFEEQGMGELTGKSLESFLPSVFRNENVAQLTTAVR